MKCSVKTDPECLVQMLPTGKIEKVEALRRGELKSISHGWWERQRVVGLIKKKTFLSLGEGSSAFSLLIFEVWWGFLFRFAMRKLSCVQWFE